MGYIREAIEYLKSYNDLQFAVINLKEEIQKLDAELKGSAICYKDMPGGSGAINADDVLINKIYRKAQAEKEWRTSTSIIKRIDRILEELSKGEGNENHGEIIRRCFIDRQGSRDIDDIADEFKYSRRQFYRIRQTALRRLAVQLFGINVIR